MSPNISSQAKMQDLRTEKIAPDIGYRSKFAHAEGEEEEKDEEEEEE